MSGLSAVKWAPQKSQVPKGEVARFRRVWGGNKQQLVLRFSSNRPAQESVTTTSW
jgi:hypothetical protein